MTNDASPLPSPSATRAFPSDYTPVDGSFSVTFPDVFGPSSPADIAGANGTGATVSTTYNDADYTLTWVQGDPAQATSALHDPTCASIGAPAGATQSTTTIAGNAATECRGFAPDKGLALEIDQFFVKGDRLYVFRTVGPTSDRQPTFEPFASTFTFSDPG
jgi:hypothetical protein